MSGPAVTVAVPVLNEELHIERCLDAIAAQSYPHIVEILVVDGGSTDRTRDLVARRGGRIRLLRNPRRTQAAGLNVALAEARGEILVRVDGHCFIAGDYVEQCVKALRETGAAVVGGAMGPVADGWLGRGIAAAMTSPLGAGPARFHRGGRSSWVDTVYLGAYRTDLGRAVGGYRMDVGVNEDAEFAFRMRPHGGIWLDDSIRSTYIPRLSLGGLVHQFYRYGRSRSATVRRHPASLAPRQLVAPLLVVALTSPWRRPVLAGYVATVVLAGLRELRRDPTASPGVMVALPAMHLPWGFGFLHGLATVSRRPLRISR